MLTPDAPALDSTSMFRKTLAYFRQVLRSVQSGSSEAAVAYLKEENRILRELLLTRYGCKRLPLTDSHRRRLAALAKPLGTDLLAKTTQLFSPDTLLKWYRRLIAARYDGSANRHGGRPKVAREVIDLVLRLACDNRHWGYGRIHYYMDYLGHPVGRSTVRRIMEDHGLSPMPQRPAVPRTTWSDFVRSHLQIIAATDFFTVELLTFRGLVRYSVMFFIDLGSRRVHIAGIGQDPDGAWTQRALQEVMDTPAGVLAGKKYLIHDRDSVFTAEFDRLAREGGEGGEGGEVSMTPLKTPRQSPNFNAYAERFVQTVKQECLDKLILTSPGQLEYVLKEFTAYYHLERPHESLGGRMIMPEQVPRPGAACSSDRIVGSERLGGLLKSYRRAAA